MATPFAHRQARNSQEQLIKQILSTDSSCRRARRDAELFEPNFFTNQICILIGKMRRQFLWCFVLRRKVFQFQKKTAWKTAEFCKFVVVMLWTKTALDQVDCSWWRCRCMTAGIRSFVTRTKFLFGIWMINDWMAAGRQDNHHNITMNIYSHSGPAIWSHEWQRQYPSIFIYSSRTIFLIVGK